MLAVAVLYNHVSGRSNYAEQLEGFFVFKTFCQKSKLNFSFPNIGRDQNENSIKIQAFYQYILPQIKEYEVNAKFDSYRAKPIPLDENDLNEIQSLLNTLRDQIAKCSDIPEEFRQRLLQKVNELQAEFNKPISDFDLALGKAGQIGMTIQKLCKNAKPLLDPINGIIRIIDKTTSNHFGLPTSDKLSLPYNSEDSSDENDG
jgi:hypothetical protein